MINNLQVLRAFAALAVAYYHLFVPVFNVGRFGVDVFFVISGFIISHVCAGRVERFLERRAVRIVPIYWFYTIVLFMLVLLAPRLMISNTANPLNLARSLLFIPYVKENGLVNPMIPAGWTLNYEVYFYLAVWILLALAPARKATLLASLLLIGVMMAIRLSPLAGPVAGFYSDPIVLEFALGVVVFELWDRTPPSRVPGTSWLLGLLVLGAGALIASEVLHLEARVPLGRLTAWGLPSAVVVAAVVFLERSVSATQPFFLLLGNASYSLYLSHIFVVEFMGRVLGPRVPPLLPSRPLGAVVALILIVAVGCASFVFLEAPMTARLRRRISPVPGGSGA